MHAAYDGELPDGWQGGIPVTKHWNGDYIHLYHVTRPCANCQAEIGLDVTRRALEGKAKNAGLLLRNCPECRKARKAGGVGSRGGTSRPTVGDPVTTNKPEVVVTAAAPNGELESLRTANVTMKEELAGLYVIIKELRERYELAPAIERVATEQPMRTYKMPEDQSLGAAVRATTKAAEAFKAANDAATRDGQNAELLQKWLESQNGAAKQNNAKMPWEGS